MNTPMNDIPLFLDKNTRNIPNGMNATIFPTKLLKSGHDDRL
jgi:hypothetical protein